MVPEFDKDHLCSFIARQDDKQGRGECAVLESFNAVVSEATDVAAEWLSTPERWTNDACPLAWPSATLPAPQPCSPRVEDLMKFQTDSLDWCTDSLDSFIDDLPELPPDALVARAVAGHEAHTEQQVRQSEISITDWNDLLAAETSDLFQWLAEDDHITKVTQPISTPATPPVVSNMASLSLGSPTLSSQYATPCGSLQVRLCADVGRARVALSPAVAFGHMPPIHICRTGFPLTTN